MTDEFPIPEFTLIERNIRRKTSTVPLTISIVVVILLGGLTYAFVHRDAIMSGRTPVESTAIKSVGYDPQSSVLEIEFVSGKVYQYFDVPTHIHSGLMSAESKGRYFNHTIKDQYRYRLKADQPVVNLPPSPVTTPISLDGVWQSTLDETYKITTQGDALELTVIRSSQIATGSGILRFDGYRWTGIFSAVFSEDPHRIRRNSQIELSQVDQRALAVLSTKLRWDRHGNEISRRPFAFQLRR